MYRNLLLITTLLYAITPLIAQEIPLTQKKWQKGEITLQVPAGLDLIAETEEEYQAESDELFFLVGRILEDPITYQELAKAFWEQMENNGELLAEYSATIAGKNCHLIVGVFKRNNDFALAYIIGVENPTPDKEDYLLNLMIRGLDSPTESTDRTIEIILQSITFQ